MRIGCSILRRGAWRLQRAPKLANLAAAQGLANFVRKFMWNLHFEVNNMWFCIRCCFTFFMKHCYQSYLIGKVETIQVPINRWLCIPYIMEYYYSSIKEWTIATVSTWMDLKNIILSEISDTEKNEYYMIPLTCESKYKWIYIPNRKRLTVTES